jgi:hypothetical protein
MASSRNNDARSEPSGKKTADYGHCEVADKITRAQKPQLGVVKIKAILHCRQNNRIGHASKSMGSDGG